MSKFLKALRDAGDVAEIIVASSIVSWWSLSRDSGKEECRKTILTECLEYCFSNNVKILLISELSRLGRNVDEVLKNVMLCKERGLNVYFQKENLSIFDE